MVTEAESWAAGGSPSSFYLCSLMRHPLCLTLPATVPMFPTVCGLAPSLILLPLPLCHWGVIPLCLSACRGELGCVTVSGRGGQRRSIISETERG